jgi:hypothetical protein
MWFPSDGIDSHEKNCPFLEEEKLNAELAGLILDECEECGYLGAFHAVSCSKIDVDLPGADWLPIV